MKNGKGILVGLGALALVLAGIFASGKSESQPLRWVLSLVNTALLGIGIFVAALLAVVVIGIVLASRGDEKCSRNKTKKPTPLEKREQTLLSEGRRHLVQLRLATNKITDGALRETGTKICDGGDRICRTLTEKPELISNGRKYLSYYLPTMETVMKKYGDMEQKGVAEEALRNRVLVFLQNALTATEKQYRNLFEAEALDMTVEMTVMTDICRQEGLLTSEELAAADDEDDDAGEGITLTL